MNIYIFSVNLIHLLYWVIACLVLSATGSNGETLPARTQAEGAASNALACVGSSVTPKCVVRTYVACSAWRSAEVCDLAAKAKSDDMKFEAERILGVRFLDNYYAAMARRKPFLMPGEVAPPETYARIAVQELTCAVRDTACRRPVWRTVFYSLRRSEMGWRITSRDFGPPIRDFPWAKSRRIFSDHGDSPCLGKVQTPVCAAETAMACRLLHYCYDFVRNEMRPHPTAVTLTDFFEYQVIDADGDGGLAREFDVLIVSRRCARAVGPDGAIVCAAPLPWGGNVYIARKLPDGDWFADFAGGDP